jgi:hypothetical protein
LPTIWLVGSLVRLSFPIGQGLNWDWPVRILGYDRLFISRSPNLSN